METEGTKAKAPGSGRTIIASLAALVSVVLASSCCLPLLPFLFAAGTAGSSAFFVKVRPFLLAASVLLIDFGFYQRWRVKQCQCKPSLMSTILLWFSAIVVLVFILFSQAIANILANLLAGRNETEARHSYLGSGGHSVCAARRLLLLFGKHSAEWAAAAGPAEQFQYRIAEECIQ